MCGAQQDSAPTRSLQIAKPPAAQRSKTSWRSRPTEKVKPAVPAETQQDADSDNVRDEPSADENLVLEQDEDEGDVADLVERDGDETKDA